MKILYVEPGKPAELRELGDALKDLQTAVGGYIEAVYPFKDHVCIICNEEGKLLGMEANRVLTTSKGKPYDIICGPFIVAGLTEDNFGDLTDKQIVKYLEKFKDPDMPVQVDEF